MFHMNISIQITSVTATRAPSMSHGSQSTVPSSLSMVPGSRHWFMVPGSPQWFTVLCQWFPGNHQSPSMVPWVPILSQVYLYLMNCGSVILDAFHLTQLDMSWTAIQHCLTIHHGWPPPGGGPDGNRRSAPPPPGTPRPVARPAWSGEAIQVFRIRTGLDHILGWTWLRWTSSPFHPG